MSKSIFNSVTETAMRLVLLINSFDRPLTFEELFAYDFIGTYGKEYGLTDSSLNGDSEFTMSKVALRRKRVEESVSYLVRNGYATPSGTDLDPWYSLTEKGIAFNKKISSTIYAEDYKLTIQIGKEQLFSSKSKPLELVLSRIEEE